MRIAALTMVHRDHWALSQWYSHHAASLGADALYVIAHGADPKIAEICPGASVLTVPRDGFAGFDRTRGQMMDGIAAGLLHAYDWVIRTDADELLCWDSARHASLSAAFAAAADAPVLTALGFDVVALPDEAPRPRALVAGRHLAFSGHYSKAVACRRAIPFQLHGVRVAPRRVDGFPFTMPRGLYLAHLKYADRAALARANAVREAVGQSGEKGAPGTGWSAASADTEAFLENFVTKPQVAWDEAEAQAFVALSRAPKRDLETVVVKARALKFPVRTTLPARIVPDM